MVQKRSGLVGVGQHRRPSDLQIFHTYGIILFRNVPNVQSLLTLQLNSISILFHLLSMFSFDVSSLSFPPVFSAPGNFWTGPGVRCAASIIRRPVRWTPPRWLRPSEIASAASAAAQKFLNIQGGPLDPLDPLDHGSLSISIISIIFIWLIWLGLSFFVSKMGISTVVIYWREGCWKQVQRGHSIWAVLGLLKACVPIENVADLKPCSALTLLRIVVFGHHFIVRVMDHGESKLPFNQVLLKASWSHPFISPQRQWSGGTWKILGRWWNLAWSFLRLMAEETSLPWCSRCVLRKTWNWWSPGIWHLGSSKPWRMSYVPTQNLRKSHARWTWRTWMAWSTSNARFVWMKWIALLPWLS